ncbi:hypothetical protein PWT90_08897 [Aphanocladium album]|nr:hypothetical protein PWT90_08897 [Aphanocladium album]
MEALGGVSSVIAVLDLSAKIAKLCFQYSTEVKDAKESINRLREQATELEIQLAWALNNGASQLERVHETLQPKSARQALSRLGLRSLKWPFERKDTERIVDELRKTTQTISLALQIDHTERLLQVDRQIVLSQLRVAEGAYFDSHAQDHGSTCLPNTRVELLQQISDWAKAPGPETQPIFWLNGMAGTGKSTISRSVAKFFSDSGLLGASFFFKKGEADRQSIAKFFTTLAADLARRKPYTVPGIKAALESDASVVTKVAKEQFDKLLMHPLSPPTAKGESVLIVVDALDECERDEDIKLLIHLFSQYKRVESAVIKLFVTSRPDLRIRLGFRSIQGSYESVVLHEIAEPVIKSDISVYLQHELASIRSQYNSLSETDQRLGKDWPGQAQFDKLLHMSIPLFIAAATICRFISETRIGTPNAQLEKVLDRQGGELSHFGKVYRPVLENLIAGIAPRQQTRILDEFRDIVGPITILGTPLSVSTLSKLLDIPKDVIIGRLAMLHSVLSVPSSTKTPVRLLHLSFRDFLIDDDEANLPFRVHEKNTHNTLANHCLRVLDALKQDICTVDEPGASRSDITAERINACLPLEMQYACLYLPYHLEKGEKSLVDGEEVHEFLKKHFLHWIEALSLLDRAWESIRLIEILKSRLNPVHGIELSELLEDAFRFLRTNFTVIDMAPLQLYCSLLLFSPDRSSIKSMFGDKISCVAASIQVERDWNQLLQILETNIHATTTVSFSHDSALMASTSLDNIVRIWRVATGECVQSLDFLILCGCIDGNVHLFHVNSGQPLGLFNCQEGVVMNVELSQDLTLAGVVYEGGSVCIWDLEQDVCLRKTLHPGFQFVKFSADLTLIAGILQDLSVQILNVETGDCVDLPNPHPQQDTWSCEPLKPELPRLAFSYDSELVLGALNKSILLWRTTTREPLQRFEGQAPISIAMFSQDSDFICSASEDHSICIWSVDTGQCVQLLQSRDTRIMSLAISPDTTLLASGGWDGTVRLSKFEATAFVEPLHDEFEWGITKVDEESDCLSPDANLIAVRVSNTSLGVWSVDARRYILSIDMLRAGDHRCAFSQDSSLVVVFDMNSFLQGSGFASMWHISTGVCRWKVEFQVEVADELSKVQLSADAAVLGLVMSLDEEIKSTRSERRGSMMQIWSSKTGETLIKSGHYDFYLQSISFSDNSQLVVCGADDGIVRIWDVNSGIIIRSLEGHNDEVRSAIFLPDATRVASASFDDTIRIWSTDSGSCLHVISAQTRGSDLRYHQPWIFMLSVQRGEASFYQGYWLWTEM